MNKMQPWGAVLVIVVAAIVTMKFGPQELQLSSDISKNFVSFFTELGAIALFVERALEVLVTPWREKDSQSKNVKAAAAKRALKANLDQITAAAQTPDAILVLAAKAPDLQKKAEESAQDLSAYRAETQRIAFVASLSVGIAVSLIGFRALNFFVQGGASTALAGHPHQLMLFQAMDVVLTGAVISGGADALHQMVTVFTNFATATKDKTQGN